MWKRLIIPLVVSVLFLTSAFIFWYLLKGFYDYPFIWTRFNNDFNFSLIPLGFNLVAMTFFSSLLTLVKPHSRLVYGVYVIAACLFALFLPVTILTIIAAIVFAAGFMFFEWSTNKLFHSYIKINFWDTYTKTIPTLITFITVVMAIGQFEATINKLDQFKISIPKEIIEKVFETASGGTVKGAHTFLAQNNTDTEELNDLIDKQLIQFGITDPDQQQEFREKVKQQLGILPTAPLTATAEATPSTTSASLESVNIPGVQQIEKTYKDQLVNQLKQQMEDQINQLISKYSVYIPALNALALFFLISILNLPVMLLSIALVVITMNTLRFLKVIDVIKVKAEIERLAW